jgi:hypothetical protein
MGDLQGRKVFKVFNQEFVVDEVCIHMHSLTVVKQAGSDSTNSATM